MVEYTIPSIVYAPYPAKTTTCYENTGEKEQNGYNPNLVTKQTWLEAHTTSGPKQQAIHGEESGGR